MKYLFYVRISFTVAEPGDLVHQHNESIKSAKRPSMLSPIQSQPNVNEFSVVFGDENERNDSQINFTNLAVDIDQTNKQILIEMSMPLAQDARIENQTLLGFKCESVEIRNDTFIMRRSTRLTRSLNNTMAQSAEIDNNRSKSSEAAIDESVKMYTTPIAQRLSFEAERTPIGKIRLRKITPKTVTPDIRTPDDEVYEIIVVRRSQNSRIHREHSDSMEMMNEFDEISPTINYPVMPMDTAAIANKVIVHPFPLSPRIILHRINSIDEYKESTTQQPTMKVKATKTKTKQTKKGMDCYIDSINKFKYHLIRVLGHTQ